MQDDLSPEDVIYAYKAGIFPMAASRDDPEFHWYDPPLRGLLPIKNLHIPRRLRHTLLRFPFEIRIDSAFRAVMGGCAAQSPARPGTWINDSIIDLFCDLHERGDAHSIEAWQDGKLAGGVYGLAIGAAFMGESMFSCVRDASKICLVHLCARLWRGGFTLFDTQFINDHLLQFGAYELPREEYRARLKIATYQQADFCLGSPQTQDEKALVRLYLQERGEKA